MTQGSDHAMPRTPPLRSIAGLSTAAALRQIHEDVTRALLRIEGGSSASLASLQNSITSVSLDAVELSDDAPESLGTAAAGTSEDASRSDHVHAHGDLAGGSLHADATTTVSGFMSPADKTKLDGIEEGATAGGGGPEIVYEVDFTGATAQDFVVGGDGDYTIDGKTWTVASTANAGTFEIDGSTGLVWVAKASTATVFATSAQSGPHLYITLSDLLGSDWDPFRRWEFAISFTSETFENGNDAVRLGLWGLANEPVPAGSAARMRLVDKANSGGTITVRVLNNATASQTGVNESASKAIGLSIDNRGVGQAYAGVSLTTMDTRVSFVTEGGIWDPFLYGDARLVIAFINASDASPTSTCTVTGLRVRAL